MPKLIFRSAVLLSALALPMVLPAQEIVRHGGPGATIARAVEVQAGQTLYFLSGVVPSVVDLKAPRESVAAYGDTRTQTISVLKDIESRLKSLGLSMGDVVKMQVFLVADPAKNNRMDFAGFSDGYKLFFGTEAQPNVPSRSTMQVAALVHPAYLVEIDVTAARR